VYTHFGSKPEMVRAMVAEGFDRLARRTGRVPKTDDAVRDLVNQGWAYRRHARADPHLYRIMFGRAVPEFQPTASDRQQGIPALEILVRAVERATDAGRLTAADPWTGAVSMWTAVHGIVSLELDGYLDVGPPFDGLGAMRRTLHALMVGLGDDPDRAAESIAATRP
jgi:AcrR family transcriptional regulator